ncbi:hypothetical protein BCR15_11500 [Tessaracoccus lapidicaptus]|uniref:Gram-positive cocci surface proteins LPxTG domain-containing protein n=1 Tax=Tessaracoccus lapidicaptus TaxID=1427523 RepID=A0A1C0ARP9_9ACTN|nr:SpaH/EbpB family LPXTG-anchored major pilin [Tessaracoccus lapidicaptus]OCL37088.1 hypothetical protein BCR15_11500 [Tessaracoccus lapidicaptus]
MKRTPLRIAGAALAAIAIATLGLAPALADAGDPYSVNGVNQENTSNKALINPDANVQLQIHKYLGANLVDTNGMPIYGDGSETTVTGLPALQGVVFDVYQVYTDSAKTLPVDLTSNAGWEAASAINGYTLTQANINAGSFMIGSTTYYLGTAVPVTTDATGTATFTKVDGVGLYLVNEDIMASTNVINVTSGAQVATSSITPTAPFFVTLPLTNPDATSRWMYDVDVYPKNQADYISLAVVDKGTTTADDGGIYRDVDYVLTSSIPDGTVSLGQYVITQDLDPTVDFAGDVDIMVGTTPLTQGTDYIVYWAPDLNTPATAVMPGATLPPGGVVTVVFTDAGLMILEDNRDMEVYTTINTMMDMEYNPNGIVPAQASLVPSEAWFDQNYPGATFDPETPNTTPPMLPLVGIDSNMVYSKYGDLVITKTDAVGGALISGAEFTVYKDANNNESCDDSDAVAANAVKAAVATGTDGIATIDGLQTSDFYDGATQTDLLTYCLVETKAPAGYNLLADPIMFQISQTSNDTLAVTNLPIKNEKSNLGNNLPLTGGEGVAALSLGGLLLIGGGTAYYVASSRRRKVNG